MSTFCLGCGNSISDGERFCGVCGRDATPGAVVPRVDPQTAFGLPPETSGKAIFSLVCGILFLILPLSILAVIFGHLGLFDIRKSGGRLIGKGLAITGMVLGYIGVTLLVTFIGFGIYAARQERKTSATTRAIVRGENSVVSSVRTLNTAEIAYSQAHRDAGYTCSLSDLSDAWGISPGLARGHMNGYVFELKDCSAAKVNGPIKKYRLVAYPAAPVKPGSPAFCSDESDVIRVSKNGSPVDCLKAGVDLSETEITHPPK